MSEKKIDLIRKMLAKAESTTPEEAQALTEAAMKMMARLGIDEAMVNASAKPDEREEMVEASIEIDGRYRDGLLYVMFLPLEAFGTCFFTRRKSYDGKEMSLRIFGRKSQVERMVIIGESLKLQSMSAMSTWWRENKDLYDWHTKHQQFLVRRQFLISFGQGAADRVRSEVSVIEQESSSTALVLANEVADAESFALRGIEGDEFKKARRLKSGDSWAHQGGTAAGRRANVGTTQVGGNSQRLIGA